MYSEIWIYAGQVETYEFNTFILGKHFMNSEIP